jgi:NAD+ diphosphatase
MASDLDRLDQHRKSSEWVAGLWRDDHAKLLKLDSSSRFTTNVGGSKLRMTKPFVTYDSQRHLLLGMVNGAPIFAVQALTEGEVHELREIGHQLTDTERDIAATATALVNWHRDEKFCPRCGSKSLRVNGGFARHCPACDRELFPRTDPAVIVAVLDDDDRLLLGRQGNWPGNRLSVLAGFVEAGESLEQAVHREVAEEVDVTVSALRYYGSQPWPFPRSLMVGFGARAASTQICIDGEEIDFADWFTRDQVQGKVKSGEVALPGRSSIASRMVAAWLDGTLEV